MRIRVMPRGGKVVPFGDASPAIFDTNTGETAPAMTLAPNLSTLEVFIIAGVVTHIAVRLIDKVWR